jgi:uncharacterized repeat protein (TIGR01451 family)
MKGVSGRAIRFVFYWLILFAFAQAFSTALEPPVVIFAGGGGEPPGVLEAAGFGPIVPEVPPVPVAFPELSLDLAVDLPEPQIGDHLTLTMTATNTGQATLRGYKIAVWLPPGLEFVQAGGNGSIVYNPGRRLVSAVPVPLPQVKQQCWILRRPSKVAWRNICFSPSPAVPHISSELLRHSLSSTSCRIPAQARWEKV